MTWADIAYLAAAGAISAFAFPIYKSIRNAYMAIEEEKIAQAENNTAARIAALQQEIEETNRAFHRNLVTTALMVREAERLLERKEASKERPERMMFETEEET